MVDAPDWPVPIPGVLEVLVTTAKEKVAAAAALALAMAVAWLLWPTGAAVLASWASGGPVRVVVPQVPK